MKRIPRKLKKLARRCSLCQSLFSYNMDNCTCHTSYGVVFFFFNQKRKYTERYVRKVFRPGRKVNEAYNRHLLDFTYEISVNNYKRHKR